MIVLRIHAEIEGWYIAGPASRCGPYLSMGLAVERAQGIVDALLTHGETARLELDRLGGPARRLEPANSH